MRFQNIPEYLSYHGFKIEASADAHTVCNVSFRISLDKAEEFVSLAEQRRQIEITSDNGDRVMSGIVFSVTVDYGVGTAVADMTIVSRSIEYQESGKERIFQDPQKTFEGILKAFPYVNIGKSEHLKDKVEEIICQHNMDDFSFLVYLANLCGTRLWLSDSGEICFGTPGTKHSFDLKETDRAKAILSRTLKARKNGRILDIETLQQLPNGVEISLDRKAYTVCSVRIFEQYDETRFRYSGYTAPYPERPKADTVLITKARVTNQNDPDDLGRIQVQFLDFEDNDTDKAWIPVLTPFVGKNKGGIVTIPDEGDEVVVVISEGSAFSINSLRNGKIPENCRDISKKHMAVKDSVITVSEDSISIADQQAIIVLDDKTITLSVDKSSVRLEAESIESESGKSVLVLKNGQLRLENGDSSLELRNGTTSLDGGSSDLVLDKGKTRISGNNIDFSTQGFSI